MRRRWQAASVAVTLGCDGALFVDGDGTPLVIPAHPAAGDSCGAGDRFASAAAEMLADGALPSEAVTVAVASASAFVAAGGASAVVGDRRLRPQFQVAGADESPFALAERVRDAGGTVVATGGCFDIVHAGHVQLLETARALGDCLIVLLNSDESVRRLKGAERPYVGERDRAALLHGLRGVDAVMIFDDDTPVAALERLRPQVFVKGADYSVADIPEAEVLARWGGQAVAVPYLQGRSTTRIAQEVARRGNQ
jgi:rfaE bifunctional protein nucleotidyltransferase chain/domain